MIMGRLATDPLLREARGGIPQCILKILTQDEKRSDDAEESTTRHKVVVWRGQATAAAKYLKKGSLVFVEGIFKYRAFTKDDTRWVIAEIHARRVTFLDRKPERQSRSKKQERQDFNEGFADESF
jgi:single-strand DNA-binding protein